MTFSSQPFTCFILCGVCVWLCLCLCVCALERTWDFKGLRRKRASAAILATRAGAHRQTVQMSYCECSPHFLLNRVPIHRATDRTTWPHIVFPVLYLTLMSCLLLQSRTRTTPTQRYRLCDYYTLCDQFIKMSLLRQQITSRLIIIYYDGYVLDSLFSVDKVR